MRCAWHIARVEESERLDGKLCSKRLLLRPNRRWGDNCKNDLRKTGCMGVHRLNATHASSWEQGNIPLESRNGRKYFDQLSDYKILSKDLFDGVNSLNKHATPENQPKFHSVMGITSLTRSNVSGLRSSNSMGSGNNRASNCSLRNIPRDWFCICNHSTQQQY